MADDIFKKLKQEQKQAKKKPTVAKAVLQEPLPPRSQSRQAVSVTHKQPVLPKQTTAKYTFAKKDSRKSVKKYRHELKFYLNVQDYALLQSQISAVLRQDKHANQGGYNIRSLYFDDYSNSAVWEKLSGVKNRKKYRIRIYDYSSEFIRLERKIKNGEYVAKDSMKLSLEEYEAIVAGDYGFLLEIDHTLAKDFYLEMKNNGLKPVAVVDYYRQAYVYPIEDVRITFDLDLRSGVFDKNIFDEHLITIPMYENNMSVLEVKFNRFLPEFVRGVLNNVQSPVRSAISKYTICRTYD